MISHLFLPNLWNKRDQPTACTSMVYILNVHWEAGKERWVLLPQRNSSASVRMRRIIKAGLKDTQRVSD